MRGLRTISVRLSAHWENGLKVADWLAAQPEVLEVMHPALPTDPGHRLWKRDFLGASGLFGFVLKPEFGNEALLSALLDDLQLFGMGFSWGGYARLLNPNSPASQRTATRWQRGGRPKGQSMRIHVGLDSPDVLIADLADGFQRLRSIR